MQKTLVAASPVIKYYKPQIKVIQSKVIVGFQVKGHC